MHMVLKEKSVGQSEAIRVGSWSLCLAQGHTSLLQSLKQICKCPKLALAKKVIDLAAPQQHNDLKITVLLLPYNGGTEHLANS